MKQKKYNLGILLVAFFILSPLVCGATPRAEVYYQGGTGMANRWRIQDRTPGLDLYTETSDPGGASVSEASGYIRTNSSNGTNGMENSYQLYAYDESYGECDEPLINGDEENCISNNYQFEFSFDVRSSGPFVVYVYVDTNDATTNRGYNAYARGAKVLKYTSDNVNMGGAAVSWTTPEKAFYIWYYAQWWEGKYGIPYPSSGSSSWNGKNYQYGLGAGVADGSWHTVTRNIKDDIENLAPTAGISGIKKIVVQGNVHMNNVQLDFDSDIWDRYEQFQTDPAWAYDTGWLDTHDLGDNPPGKMQCLASSVSREADCTNPEYNGCHGLGAHGRTDFVFDASDMPSAVMNDCYITLFSKYTYDGLPEGNQESEIVAMTIDNGASIQTLTLDDPGEGPQVVTANEPITLTRGLNTFYTQSPGYCGEGHSVHYGRSVRTQDGMHGIEQDGLDAFRVRCGPGASALNLNIDANPNPIFQTGADTTHISWDSQNATRCVPSGGYYNSATSTNDWQNMTPAWSDLTVPPASAGYDVPTSTFSTTAFNIATGAAPPLFTTNALPYTVTYTLQCHNATNTREITKSEVVSVLGPGCWNDANCSNFEWKQVNSRNDTGNDYRNDDPVCHPGWSDDSNNDTDGNCNTTATPSIPEAYMLQDQAQDNDIVVNPVRMHLDAGNHTLVFKTREDNATLDKVLITSDLGYTPNGLNESSDVDKIWIEAEDGTTHYGSAITEIEDYTASGYKAMKFYFYDWEMAQVTYYNTYLKIDYTIPVSGTYVIWARTGTRNLDADAGDSFWVAPSWTNLDGDSSPSYIDDRYEFVLFDTGVSTDCCSKFDFWGGAEGDKGTAAGSNPPAINAGDSITLWWEAGNLESTSAEMNPSDDIDPAWGGIKPAENSPFLSTHVPAPPPSYNSKVVTPPGVGVYKYQLTGFLPGGFKTETKEVEVTVGAVAPLVVPGQCGEACNHTHCNIPTESFCTPPSTIAAPGTPQVTVTGWEWDCEGLNGGVTTSCQAERKCGWEEK